MFFSPKITAASKNRSLRLNVEVLESRITPTAPAGNSLLWQVYAPANAFTLHSNPGVTKIIYLDFDGETISGTSWNTNFNAGLPITAAPFDMDGMPGTFTAAERNKIIDMWRRIAEDFVPFDVDVTTQFPGVAALQRTSAADTQYGQHVVICPRPTVSTPVFGTTDWDMVGGIAPFIGSFDAIELVDEPAWAFDFGAADPLNEIPTAASHEIGHTLGLSHDGDLTMPPPPDDEYYPGHGGVGITSWGTIMGAAYNRNLDQWSRNTYPGANNAEDDLLIISTTNGFGNRPDDYGNTPASGKQLNGALQPSLGTTYGIIGRNTDFDYFKFYADPGPINITIDPLFVGPNLDVRADLYNASGTLIMSLNPAASINATFSLNLTTKGLHSIRVSSGDLAGPMEYVTYGSIGSYRVTGTVTPFTPATESFKNLNPLRWKYTAFTGIYDGYITIGNISGVAFSGKFLITLTLPDASVRVIGPKGVQSGKTFTVLVKATISPTKPFLLHISVKNPKGFNLSTGTNSWISNIQYVP